MVLTAGTARPDNYKQVIKNILRSDPSSAFTGVPGANTGSISLSLPLNDDSSGDSGSSPRLFGQNFGLGFGLPSFCYSSVSAAPQNPTFPNFGPSQPIETSLI
ncbi:unnamed protein product [Clavelina lepadiformis]|uniref:Uncharacterized protein n=1 Tax=Clavelina lepadiformis TaxID=159417 RepID=A0ABP0G405_CLALP